LLKNSIKHDKYQDNHSQDNPLNFLTVFSQYILDN
jgi:hypothetical protein